MAAKEDNSSPKVSEDETSELESDEEIDVSGDEEFLTMKRETVQQGDESSDEGEEGSSDSEGEIVASDKQLQRALAEGHLKPGLNFLARPPKEYIDDVAGMKDALAEFKENLDWIERLDVTTGPIKPPTQQTAEDEEFDVEDYFKRELKFYQQAQAAVLEALPRLNSLDVQTRRPDDYFAEMAKPDILMKKIRAKLIKKQISLEKSEKAKKLRELRKFGKKVQQEVLLARQKEKSDMMKRLKKITKGKREEETEELKAQREKGKKRKLDPKNTKEPKKLTKKQKYKESKYGYGGKKRREGFNDKASHNAEDDGFTHRTNNKDFFKGKGRPGAKKGMKGAAGKKTRPGKGRRNATKARKGKK